MDEILRLGSTVVCALGLLILYAGVNKFRYLANFRTTLLYVPYMPTRLVPFLAIAIPIVEVLAGVSLALGTRVGIALTLVLLFATSAVAVLAHKQKRRVPCICFSSAGADAISLLTVVRNLIFGAIALLPALLPLPSPNSEALLPIYAVLLVVVFFVSETLLTNLSSMKTAENN